MTTEILVGLVALAIIASVSIFTYIIIVARRNKAKRQLQTLLGAVYPSANRKTK